MQMTLPYLAIDVGISFLVFLNFNEISLDPL